MPRRFGERHIEPCLSYCNECKGRGSWSPSTPRHQSFQEFGGGPRELFPRWPTWQPYRQEPPLTETLVRTRTRPEIKWLANELAATRGEVERLDAEIALLEDRKKRLLDAYAAMAQVAGQMGALELPNLVPTVTPHDSRYGGRGRLRGLLKDTLKAAYPRPIDSRALLELAVQTFGLEFSTPAAKIRYYDNTFRRQLLALTEQGLLERVAVQGLVKTGWRWRVDAPALDELRAKEDLARGGSRVAVRSREGDGWRSR
jgi:hypothetical protein